jgi:aminobenzoyl-glutamate transport protein
MNVIHPINQLLHKIEHAGNKLPHPTLIFVYLCLFTLLLSSVLAWLGVAAVHPLNSETIAVNNLLNQQGLHRMLQETVSNFINFAPVGTVLVAIMGIGVAERSGLLGTALRACVLKAPAKALSFIVVLMGVLSSLAADTGYVVLIPLAAMVFKAAGRDPVAGIAAAFAGVSGGFSANLLIGPIDVILAGLSTEAAQLIATNYQVSSAGNYYFMLASTLLIAITCTWVTEKFVVTRLINNETTEVSQQSLSPDERRGLKAAGGFTLIFAGLLLWGTVPADGILRGSDGSVLRSPFISGVVTIIALYAALAGLVYSKASGERNKQKVFIEGMESSMETMASYLVLMFFAAQFVSYFAWSQLGIITAINGAAWLQALPLSKPMLLLSFVFMTAFINLLIGSSSAKWALLAPIFIPMFFLLGISPEATQVAYRIGDSTTNIITPLMPYFGVVVAFVQRYEKSAGIGTVIAMMLPYSFALLVVWLITLGLWLGFEWPLGPGAGSFL